MPADSPEAKTVTKRGIPKPRHAPPQSWDHGRVNSVCDWASRKLRKDPFFSPREAVGIRKSVQDIAKNEAERYLLRGGIGTGSSGVVLKLEDRKTHGLFALKIPRVAVPGITRVVRGEAKKLRSLNHSNLVRLLYSGEFKIEIDPQTPLRASYYVEEYLDGDTLDEWLEARLSEVKSPADALQLCRRIVNLLRQLFDGVAALHRAGIVHCDLKPKNIMVVSNDRPVIIDLGFAHWFPPLASKGATKTPVGFTWPYGHPELKAALVKRSRPSRAFAEIPRSALRKDFDLYSLGVITLEVQGTLHDVIGKRLRGTSPKNEAIQHSQYLVRYLELVALRLLCGYGSPEEEPDLPHFFRALKTGILSDIRFQSADEARNCLARAVEEGGIERGVPEVDPGLTKVLRQVVSPVPFTDRVREIYNEDLVKRLARITQLGLVVLVYPGAQHSRREHVFGTFAMTCRFVRALWDDPTNPSFRCLMDEEDVKALLLASIFHDLGQFPMAHDVEDILPGVISHEELSRLFLGSTDPELLNLYSLPQSPSFHKAFESLKATVERGWGEGVLSYVLRILSKKERDVAAGSVVPQRTFSKTKLEILHQLISGPIEADKLDYMLRDCAHLGPHFAEHIELDQLLCNASIGLRGSEGRLGLAFTEKGVVAAQSVLEARSHMFDKVYWHKTVRGLKAVLALCIQSALLESKTGTRDEMEKRLRSSLTRFAIGEQEFFFTKQTRLVPEDDMFGEMSQFLEVSELPIRDFNLLVVIGILADGRQDVKDLLAAISHRKPFKRAFTIKPSYSPGEKPTTGEPDQEEGQTPPQIFPADDKLPAEELVAARKELSKAYRVIVGTMQDRKGGFDQFHRLRTAIRDKLAERMKDPRAADDLTVLVDVPLRSSDMVHSEVWQMSEDSVLAHPVPPDMIRPAQSLLEHRKIRIYVSRNHERDITDLSLSDWVWVLSEALELKKHE